MTAFGTPFRLLYVPPTKALTKGRTPATRLSLRWTCIVSTPPTVVDCTAKAIRSPFATVLLPVVGTLSCQAFAVIPPPPPALTEATSKVIRSATFTARPGGPVPVSTAANPIDTEVPTLAKVTDPLLHPNEEDPLVSIVCEPPSSVKM